MAEDRFEAVDPLARVSKQNGLALFLAVPEFVSEADDIPLDSPLVEEKPDDRHFDENDELLESESFDKTHDPVRLYLREMGSVPLLNREGEIAIARRIERGQTKTRRILSRCPMIIQEMVRLGQDLRLGRIAARDVLQFHDPIPSDETYENGASQAVAVCDELSRLRRRFLQLRQRLVAVPRQSKPKQNRALRWELDAWPSGSAAAVVPFRCSRTWYGNSSAPWRRQSRKCVRSNSESPATSARWTRLPPVPPRFCASFAASRGICPI